MTHGMKFVSILGSQLILWGGGFRKIWSVIQNKTLPPFWHVQKNSITFSST